MNWKIFYKSDKFEYAVNEEGQVKNLTTDRIMKPQIGFQGYYYIRYGGRKNLIKETVHRIVAKAFADNPKGWNVVDHKDGCKLNNKASNLEWVEHNENMRRMAAMGCIKNQRCKKLTPDEVFDIRTLGLYSFPVREIAESFNVHENTVRKILNCEDWRHEPMPERKKNETSFQGMELQECFAQAD